MYPLHMKSAAGGFALANDETEHRSLTEHGYEPKLVEPLEGADTDAAELAAEELAALRAEAKAAGVKSSHLMGRDKLLAALGR